MNENKLKFSVNTERLAKLGPNFLQSKDGQNALAAGSLKGEDRLFMAFASSSLLNTTMLLPGKKIIELGEQFEDAYFLLSGEVQILQNDKSYKLGAGSVIGLSEGMVGLASKFSATALTSVQVKIIPFHRVGNVIKNLPAELRAILVTIIKRNLAA
jgi:CRP-like cAMP-binding protein